MTLMREFKSILATNAWVTYMPMRRCAWDVWSDASLTGWAYLLTRTGTEDVLGGYYGRFMVREAIHVLELRASVWLIERVVQVVPQGTIIIVYCDNTTAVAALRRGRGSCWATNQVMLQLTDAMLKRGVQLDVRWISTKKMIADAWTRIRVPSGAHAMSIGPGPLGQILQTDQTIGIERPEVYGYGRMWVVCVLLGSWFCFWV